MQGIQRHIDVKKKGRQKRSRFSDDNPASLFVTAIKAEISVPEKFHKYSNHVLTQQKSQQLASTVTVSQQLEVVKKKQIKIFGYSEGEYGGSWCEGEGPWRQDAVEERHTLWQALVKGKGRKKKSVLKL